ncbi:MAG: hypothetical protein EOP09_03240, partial [Proteobacteria bacterium]
MDGGPLYKVQHHSGRILGPVGLDRIKRLIKRREIRGTEVARRYPEGQWLSINNIPEISEMLLLQAQGKLQDPLDSLQTSYEPILSNPHSRAVVHAQAMKTMILDSRPGRPKDDSEQLTELITLGNQAKIVDLSESGNEDPTQRVRGDDFHQNRSSPS